MLTSLRAGAMLLRGTYVAARAHRATGHRVRRERAGRQRVRLVAHAFVNSITSDLVNQVVFFGDGGGNQFLDIAIDGGYQGQCSKCAADDGILLNNEDGDTIRGNTIQNVFDAGVEGLGILTNTVITGNRIVNAAFAGIGAYWCTHWQGNSVSGNDVSASPRAAYFDYEVDGAHCSSQGLPSQLFINNTITGNVLRASPPPDDGFGMAFKFGSGLTGPNVISGNNIGSLGIYVHPETAFVNGGGNTCGSGGNFVC
jgi:hypothetical protein